MYLDYSLKLSNYVYEYQFHYQHRPYLQLHPIAELLTYRITSYSLHF